MLVTLLSQPTPATTGSLSHRSLICSGCPLPIRLDPCTADDQGVAVARRYAVALPVCWSRARPRRLCSKCHNLRPAVACGADRQRQRKRPETAAPADFCAYWTAAPIPASLHVYRRVTRCNPCVSEVPGNRQLYPLLFCEDRRAEIPGG